MPEVRKLALLAALAAAAIIQPATANGGAAAAAVFMNEQQSEQIPLPPGHNDGFIEASVFYREGPVFRVCPDRKATKVSVQKGQCKYRIRSRNGFMDWSDRFESEPAVGMQEFLDDKFGDGVTEFAGVSSRMRGHSSSLVIFYRLRDRASLTPQ